MLNPFNPSMGEFELAPLWGIGSFFAGLLSGFVREKTGTVLSARQPLPGEDFTIALLHG